MKTGSNLKNGTATVTVINNFTANIGAGTNKQTAAKCVTTIAP
ncbi:MAG: hypothetical protein WBZ36_03175 [Candidatus Nitrosopolaris sp.]